MPGQVGHFEKLWDYDLRLADEEGRQPVNDNDGNAGAIPESFPGDPSLAESALAAHRPRTFLPTPRFVPIAGSTSPGKTTTRFYRMDPYTAQLDLLIDLEARHEDLLVQLDELDKRVERTLAECQRYRSDWSPKDTKTTKSS